MASTSVGVRELRQNLSKHLERVKRGETLTVTDRGREVAKLVPSILDDHPSADLARKHPGTILSTRPIGEIIDELPPVEPRSAAYIEELLEDTAVRLTEEVGLDAILTYDRRLADGARHCGLTVLSATA